jgi:hypothetical protein
MGLTGAQGSQGIQGEKGDTGLTGAQGLQGIPGEQGEPGVAGFYSRAESFEVAGSSSGISGSVGCDAGDAVTGGGFEYLSGDARVERDKPVTALVDGQIQNVGWNVSLDVEPKSGTHLLSVWVFCADLP